MFHCIRLHYRHFKRHLHLKWPVVHQQLHVIRNTAHRPSTQASYTASRVRSKRKISCAAAQIAATQIAATLTISFPRWHHMSLSSYWGQQRLSLTSYPGHRFRVMHAEKYACASKLKKCSIVQLYIMTWRYGMKSWHDAWCQTKNLNIFKQSHRNYKETWKNQEWCTTRRLQLNPDKTELIWFASRHLLQQLPPDKSSNLIQVCGFHVKPLATLAFFWTVNLPGRLILAKVSRPGFPIASDSFETFSIEIFVKDWCRRWYYRGSTTVTHCLPGCQRRRSSHFRDWSTQQHVIWRISGPTTV